MTDDEGTFEEFLQWRRGRRSSVSLLTAAEKGPSPFEKQVETPFSGPRVFSEFGHDEEEQARALFVSWAPKKAPPYGLTLEQVKAAKWRALAAVIVFVALAILFAVVGTQTFWATAMKWQTWYTLFVIIIMLSCLVLDLWDVSLTFFVANTALLLAKIITVADALAGFSNEGVLSTAIMFVIARAIEKTRVLEWVVRVVLRRPRSLRSALLRLLPASALWSCWTNNTPIVACLIPVVETWAVRADIPVSLLLMPMSFAVILGGLVTIIGTSTSLVIQGLAGQLNLGFFQVGALGAPFAFLGILTMIVFGPFLLPKQTGERGYVQQAYAWHKIAGNSSLIGSSLLQTKLLRLPGAELLWLKPHGEDGAHFVPDAKGDLSLADAHLAVLTRPLAEGDLLCYVGVRECIEDVDGLAMSWYSGSQLDGLSFFDMHLSSSFPVEPMSVKDFNAMFNCRVRRVIRRGSMVHLQSGSVRDGVALVEAGDVCIVEAGFELLHLQRDPRMKRVGELDFTVGKVQSALPLAQRLHPFIAVFSLLAIVVLNATQLFTIYEAAAMAIILLLITDTMSWKDVYMAIPVPGTGNLMLMICYSFALSAAMTKSGLGSLIGRAFAVAFVGSPYVQLLGIYLCSTLITAITPNAATATIMFPIVVNMSKAGGFSLLAGIYCMMIASSADFMTPFGYTTNLMIQKPGGYKFQDYIKLGGPVTLIGLFLCPAIAMWAWPYDPLNIPCLTNCTRT